MKPLFTFLLVFFACSLLAQNRQLSVDLNRSFHGSGDMRGAGFAVEYGKFIKPKVEWTGSLGANIHHSSYGLTVDYGNGPIDASYRTVTAGIQLGSQLWFAPLHTVANEFKIGAGPFLRYQSSGAADSYGVTFPVATGYPEPVFTFRNNEPQNRLTAGYQVSLSYAYTFAKRFFIGAKASFQNDTNADVLTHYGLRIGKRF